MQPLAFTLDIGAVSHFESKSISWCVVLVSSVGLECVVRRPDTRSVKFKIESKDIRCATSSQNIQQKKILLSISYSPTSKVLDFYSIYGFRSARWRWLVLSVRNAAKDIKQAIIGDVDAWCRCWSCQGRYWSCFMEITVSNTEGKAYGVNIDTQVNAKYCPLILPNGNCNNRSYFARFAIRS